MTLKYAADKNGLKNATCKQCRILFSGEGGLEPKIKVALNGLHILVLEFLRSDEILEIS